MQILAQILPSWFAQIKKDPPGGNCSFIAHGYNWEKNIREPERHLQMEPTFICWDLWVI